MTTIDTGLVHRDGHDTEQHAAAVPGKRRQRDDVLIALAVDGGLTGRTDDRLAALTGLERYVAGTRRGELVAAGLVEKTDRRAPSRKGNPSIVWRCTAAGFDVAARLLDASAGVLGDPRTIRLRENGQVARSRERFRDEVDGARARAGEGAR